MTANRRWLSYFKDPSNIGPMDEANALGDAGGGCGDHIRMYLKIKKGKIAKAAFLASGCPAAIAGASACAKLVSGKTYLEAARLTSLDIARELGDVPIERRPCLELSVIALSMAFEKYQRSNDLSLAASPLILVAMSGGVDSSIAAAKLFEQNKDILGVTLRLHEFGIPAAKACCSTTDIADARSVAAGIGFPHLVIDMRKEFKKEVIDDFCQSYLRARTPNPCVECNRKMRFGHLLRKSADFGASAIATGHYVRITKIDSRRFGLSRARDLSKDQSYMFWAATQDVLANYLAPLGDLKKTEVRELAASLDLPVAGKAESQDVCFVPDGDYLDFVCRATDHHLRPGIICNRKGELLGQHRGLVGYTVGQRKGLGLSSTEPYYVVELNVAENKLVVGRKRDLEKDRFSISQLNIVQLGSTTGSFKAEVMTRYNGPLAKAQIHITGKTEAVVEFKKPFGPIAPGQSAVFYDNDTLLGGGIID